jgi:hypothetical protein
LLGELGDPPHALIVNAAAEPMRNVRRDFMSRRTSWRC